MASAPLTVGPFPGLSRVTPITTWPFLTASKSRQCPAYGVHPVLMPTAPG
jgi:hypothetical protein